jgi:hypothetical protein
MSAFPETVNEFPEDFFASLETLDPKHDKKASPVPVNTSVNKFEYLLAGDIATAGFTDESSADQSLCSHLAKKGLSRIEVELIWKRSLPREKLERRDYIQRTLDTAFEGLTPRKIEVDPERWREFCKTFGQLTTEEPRYIVDQLIPEGAMSAITGHSFHSKTWVALMIALAISQGNSLWNYFNVTTPRPVIYHCPEMSEAMIRHYLHVLGAEDDENLLVRPMESGVWPLDDPLFLRSSIGRVTFLDTGGFFNPAEDGNDYKQALQFARLVFEAITAGCLGVIPLFHLAKGVKKEDWSLENSIIGSAGYGAMLRSCLRVFNLNSDLNDPNVHLYLQGMKNPGLKPFQLVGPAPLTMRVEPGDSPYLKVLMSGDQHYIKASELFEKGKTQRDVAEQLSLSLGKVNKLHKRWEGKTDAEEDDGPSY